VRPLLTRGWLVRHVLAVTLVLASAGLTWWQFARALDGNPLSYGYALLWPVFGAFVAIIWVREIRLAAGGHADRVAAGSGGPPGSAVSPAPPAGESAAPAREPVASGFGRPVIVRRPVTPAAAAVPEEEDPALAEYNRLLAWLAAHPGARPADYPG
jgi:hypothetical protein